MLNGFDRQFGAFAFDGQRAAVAAVSGGSDSTALLLALHDFLTRRHPSVRLVAVTIDHQLRAGSREEAETVAALCARRGIEHRILAWEGGKPGAGLSAAAREARYRLLGQAADAAGASLIFTGHTLNDQAETIAMRQARTPGQAARGLSGMAEAALHDGRRWILRPFLGVARQALRRALTESGFGWADDPGNFNPAHERIAARQRIEAEGEAALLARLASIGEAQERRQAVSVEAAREALAHFSMPEPGLFRFSADFRPDSEAGLLLLRAAIAMAGGAEQLPPEEQAADMVLKPGRREALGGAVIAMRRDGFFLHREWRGEGPVIKAVNGIWDGRFRITSEATEPNGRSGRARGSGRLSNGARDAEPASDAAIRIVSPFSRFLPGFDHALCLALARAAGAEIPPPLPYAGHMHA